MIPSTSRRIARPCCSALLALLGACSEASSGSSAEAGGVTSTGEPASSSTSTGGPEPSGGVPTTGGAVETGFTDSTSSTTEVASSTGQPGPSCGDGVVDSGEQCDDGPANSDNNFCTTTCQLNYCGDGHLFLGWELCDEGEANSDSYGNSCSDTCTPAPRCGDHIVQVEAGEECDIGVNNGGPMGDEQGILCEASCRSKSLRAFVTSQAFTGDLGGLPGADQKCRDAATVAGLPEPYRFYAYLSTPDVSANDRFPGPMAEPLPYVLVTGKKLADSHTKLLYEGPQGEGLSITELGTSLYDLYVATNTSFSGNSYSPDQHCLAWTSTDPLLKVRVGLTFPSDPGKLQAWVSNGEWVSKLTLGCTKPVLHLYCLEI